MNAFELNKDLLTGGIYCLSGNDSYWIKYAENVFRAMLPEDSLSFFVFDKIYDISEAINALFTLSFDSDYNVVLVRDGDYKADDKAQKILNKVLQEDIGRNFLVFSGVSFLTPSMRKKVKEIDCGRLDKFKCAKYAQTLFPQGIEKKALDLLIEYTNCDMARIYTEKEKLISYCNNSQVTLDSVQNLVSNDTELQIYEFVNSIVTGKKKKALSQMEKLINRGEAPSYLISSLISQFRRMLHCSLSKLDNKTLAEIFNVKEYAILMSRENNSYSKLKLKSIIEMLIEAEYNFKSGIMSEKTAFDTAIANLLQE